MTLLYLTADVVGMQSGGGLVTHHESEALKSLGPCEVWGRDFLDSVKKYYLNAGEPWQYDINAGVWLHEPRLVEIRPTLVHCYAGTFSSTVERLQADGAKVTYTAAAHSVEASRFAHTELGIPYDFPHLTDPEQWQRYLKGYLLADVLVCPSTHSADVMRSYGRTGPIEIIPHGCYLPDAPIQPQPERFTVGYLGSYGPDKGVRFLLEAWKKLDYKDATLLLGGRDSQSPFVDALIQNFGGGNIERVGWLDNVGDFYNRCSLYVQPSVTEGFGIEILEAMAHGRSVLASTGAGASALIPHSWRFAPRDVHALMFKIDMYHKYLLPNADLIIQGQWWRSESEKYTWDVIRAKYVAMWQNLLKEE